MLVSSRGTIGRSLWPILRARFGSVLSLTVVSEQRRSRARSLLEGRLAQPWRKLSRAGLHVNVISGRNAGATEQISLYSLYSTRMDWEDSGRTKSGLLRRGEGRGVFAIKIYIHFPRLVNVRGISLQGLRR